MWKLCMIGYGGQCKIVRGQSHLSVDTKIMILAFTRNNSISFEYFALLTKLLAVRIRGGVKEKLRQSTKYSLFDILQISSWFMWKIVLSRKLKLAFITCIIKIFIETFSKWRVNATVVHMPKWLPLRQHNVKPFYGRVWWTV